MSTSSLYVTLLSVAVIQCCVILLVTGQIFEDYACVSDNIVLSCQDNKNISITEAFYGQYDPICSNPPSDCCAPQDTDCTRHLEEVYPDDWTDLLEECDGKLRCEYRVLGGSLDECGGFRLVQYLHVYHRCIPEDPTTAAPTTEEVTTQSPTPAPTTTSPRRTPVPPTTPGGDDGGLSGGVIAAIVIGVLLFIAIVAMIVIIVWRKLHPPPKPKKVVRRRVGKKSTVVYDNEAFASTDQVVVHLDQDSKTIPNGVHNNNKNTGPPVVSDGKRKPRPVTSAESFRYAQEKETLASKYKTDTDGKSTKSRTKNKNRAKTPSGSNELAVDYGNTKQANQYENLDYANTNGGQPLNAKQENQYEHLR